MKKLLAIALLMSAFAAVPASAQMRCAPHSVIEELNEQHGMETANIGLVGNDAIVTYANPQTGRFVIVVRRIDGITCVLAAGTDYEAFSWGIGA